jgi:hypothetical protein
LDDPRNRSWHSFFDGSHRTAKFLSFSSAHPSDEAVTRSGFAGSPSFAFGFPAMEAP